MRKYKYCAILGITTDGKSWYDIVWDVYGVNKEDAIKNIDLSVSSSCVKYSVKSIKRINITERKRNRRDLSPSIASVDMGQCSM